MQDIPKTLYKYRVWGDPYHQRLLTHKEVFLASPANLNDPFDASLPFRYDPSEMTPANITKKLLEQGRDIWPEISEEELHSRAFREQSSGKFESDAYWKDEHERSKGELHNKIGLLSLTTNTNNQLMWAHYANSHKGFCVGINSKILFDSVGGTIGRVSYREDFPFMPLFPEGLDSIKTMVEMLNTKSPDWSYEDEYRLSRSGASNRPFELPHDAITEVILGCRMSMQDREEIIKTLDEELPHIRIFQAEISLTAFKLDVHETAKINFK